MAELKHIIVTVRRKDGSIFDQEIIVNRGQTPWQAMNAYQMSIDSKPYKWYTDPDGKKVRYQVGYVCESWRFKPTKKMPKPEKYQQLSIDDIKGDDDE